MSHERRRTAGSDESQVPTAALPAPLPALDREIERSGAPDRVTSRVMARIAPRRTRRAIWLPSPAALIVAAGLGSLVDLVFVGARISTGQEVVVMDPLVFGPAVTRVSDDRAQQWAAGWASAWFCRWR